MALQNLSHSKVPVRASGRSAQEARSMVPVLAVGKLVRSNRVCSAADDATSLGVEHSKQALVRSRQPAGRLELVDSRLVLEPGHSKRVLEVGKQEYKLVRRLISFCKTNRR